MIDLRKNKPVSILIAVTLLASVLAVSALSARRHEPQKTVQTAATPSQAITPAAAPDDMRGVWITYMELSMENEADRAGRHARRVDHLYGIEHGERSGQERSGFSQEV